MRVGVDIGGTKCLGVAISGAEVVAEVLVPAPTSPAAMAEVVPAMVRSLQEQAGSSGPVEVGVGVPGLVDLQGTLRFAPNLGGLNEVAIAQVLGQALGGQVLGGRVVVANDATCAALAEQAMGAGRGRRDLVLATLGTGIGGGLVVGGQLVLGHRGFAGEIGHMVVDPQGVACPCGRRGCWERYASGTGLGRLGSQAARAGRADGVLDRAGGDPEAVRGEHVSAAAAEGDNGGRAVMEEWAGWVALGLANLTAVFDPEIFILAGGLAAAGDVMLEPIRRCTTHTVDQAGLAPAPEIVTATLGVRAGAIGAALLPGSGS